MRAKVNPCKTANGEGGYFLRSRPGFRALRLLLTAAPIVVAAAIAQPAVADFAEAAKDTKPVVDVRYRLETVNQAGFEEDAGASTARLRLGWVMAPSDGLSAGVQADYVAKLGAEDYNSTDNGRTEFPVVADPTGFDLNQAFVRYRKGPVTVTAGRQRIAHPGQHFVGFKAWRQNEQSFDGLRIEAVGQRTGFDYAYLARVNRIFGPRDGAQPSVWSGDSHLLRATFTPVEGHSLATFTYLLDFENDNGPANSSATFGVDYAGTYGPYSLDATVARQSDWAHQPLDYIAPYYSLRVGWADGGVKLGAGWEVLGSDDGMATVQMPIGAEHIYRGWTDKFAAVKPATGLQEVHLSASVKLGDVTFATTLHSYEARQGGMDYGAEAGVSAAYARDSLSLLLKLARYEAEDYATDTTKAWFMLVYSL